MFVPPEFNKLCFYFHQDVGVDGSTPGEWITFAKRHIDENERSVVKHFVQELLNGPYDRDALQRIWFSTDAEIGFPEEQHLREFLALIRDSM
jgi:hypothetical protein